MAEYVYGVVRPAGGGPAGEGIAGAPLRLVEGAGAAALVSRLPGGELRFGRDELMTHARVLTDALAAGPVLPMRAGIVMGDDQDIRSRLLEARGEALRRGLDRFAGTFQADVRAVYDEEALMREVVEQDRDVAALRRTIAGRPAEATYPERIRLGELVAAGVERIRERDASGLVELLQQVSEAVDVAPPTHERVALNASFLIQKARAQEFDDVLEAFAAGQAGRLRVRYTGPLPPHSFVTLEEAA